jgi:circadian clock protein KaiB
MTRAGRPGIMPPPAQTARPRILLVDDDHDVRTLMAMALNAAGYVVDEAADAVTALEALRRGGYALLCTDHRMPNRTGAWLIQEASRHGLLRHTASVMVTAEPSAPDVGGCARVFAKPVDLRGFLEQIRAILGERRGADSLGPGEGEIVMTPRVELALYVTPNSLPCERALRVMLDILGRYDAASVDFRVVDLTDEPDAAERDRIIFTPTLVKRLPPPNVWILGDLSKPEVVIDLLQMCGIATTNPS